MIKKYLSIALLCFISCVYSEAPVIDVIIPCHDKDKSMLPLVIAGIRQNIKDVRRIIVISHTRFTEDAEWFDEKHYPFSKKDIAYEIFQNTDKALQYIENRDTRIGWIYQQFLKLYAPFVIPDIAQNVLVVDADVVFLRPVTFFSPSGKALYTPGKEYYIPYFEHAARVLPNFKKVYKKISGIAHHMLFQKNVLEDMFKTIKAAHQLEPWKVFCRCIDHAYLGKDQSSMSEYELYFNFIFSGGYRVKLRNLHWKDVRTMAAIKQVRNSKFHYVACHRYAQIGK